MKCPHCLITIHDNEEWVKLLRDCKGQWYVYQQICPNCKQNIISLECKNSKFLVFPKSSKRDEAPKETPAHIAEDYNEATSR
jgi:hypothetical protein